MLFTVLGSQRIWLFSGAVSLLALSACSSGEDGPSAEATQRSVEYAIVQSYSPSADAIYVGQLQNAQTSTLSFEVPGIIRRIDVDLGDTFKANQILATLDTQNFDLDIERREASLLQGQAELVNAEQDFVRKNALRGTGAISGAMIDAAKARLDGAVSSVEGLKTALAQAKKAKADTRLRAPFSGTVLSRLSEPGQTLSPGQAVLSVSENDQNLEALISLTQNDIGSLSIGDRLLVRITALDRIVPANVTEISTTAGSSLAFPVTLTLETSDGLRAGMGIEVALGQDGENKDDVIVPLTAVQTDSAGQYFVYEINGEQSATAVNVQVLRVSDTGYVLSKGPQVGARIISRGAVQVKPGEPLRLLDPDTRRFPE